MFRFFRVVFAKLIQLVVFIFRLLIAPFVIASLNIKYFSFSSLFSYARSGVREHAKLKKVLKLLPKDLVTKNIFEQLLKANGSTLNHLERVSSILKSRDILHVLNKESLNELIYVCREQPLHLTGLYFICEECHLLLKSSDSTKDINRFIKILKLKKDITAYKKIFLEFNRLHFEDLENLFDILIDDFILAKQIYDFIDWRTKIYEIKKPTIILKITDKVKLKHLLESFNSLKESKVFIYKRADINRKFELIMDNIDRIENISAIFQHPVIKRIFDNPEIPSIYNRTPRVQDVMRAISHEESTELFDVIVSAGPNQHNIIIRLLELPYWLSLGFTDKQYLNVIVLLKNLSDENAKLLSQSYSDDTFFRKIKVLLKLKESTNFLSGDPDKIAANIGFVLRSQNLGKIDEIIRFTDFMKATFPQFLTDEVIKFAFDNPSQALNLKTMLERQRDYGNYRVHGAYRAYGYDIDYPESLATKQSVSDTDHAKLLALDLLLVVEQQRKSLPRDLSDVIPTTGYVGDRANVAKARERCAKLKTLYDGVFCSPLYSGSLEAVEQQIKITILNSILEAANSASLNPSSVCYDPNKEAIIQLLTHENIRILAQGTNSILAAQARQLFVVEDIPAQTAWRAYDYAAQRRQGYPSLFVINPNETIRTIHDNGPNIEIGSAIREIRTMCAYTYLSAIDTTTSELAVGTTERISKLINTIAEIMRGLNNGQDYTVKGPDTTSCFPGAISRLGLACLSHPHFVKELEAAPLQIHAKVQAIAQRKLEAIISGSLHGETWSIEDKQSLYYASMVLGLDNAREILSGADKLEFLALAEIDPKKIFASRARFLNILFAQWNHIIEDVRAYLAVKGIRIDSEAQMKFYILRSLLDLKGLKLTLTTQQKIQIGLLSAEQVTAMDDTEDMPQDFFPEPQPLVVLQSQKKYTDLTSLAEREKYLIREYYLPWYKHQDYQALLRQCQDLEIKDSAKYCRDIIETRYLSMRGVASEQELQTKLKESQRSGQNLIAETKQSNQIYSDWQLPAQLDSALVDMVWPSTARVAPEAVLPFRRFGMR